jgi:hypothetical protein
MWCERFPWAAAFAVLLARASREAGHGDSERDLLRACAHAPNRQTVFTTVTSDPPVEVAGVAGSRNEVAGVAGSRDEVAGVAGSRDEVAGVAGSRDEGKIPRVIVADNVLVRVDSPNFSSTSTSTSTLSLEDTILAEAVARSIELDVIAYVPESEPDPEVEVAAGPRSFAQWLSDRAGQTGWGGGLAREEETKKRGEAEILERFIRENPRIGRVREEVDPRVEGLARASVEEWDGMEELVTETMAQLYVRQGQRTKAKRAYELLALKYPEKSAYFAAALKNLG